jgi:hypothetical protein
VSDLLKMARDYRQAAQRYPEKSTSAVLANFA